MLKIVKLGPIDNERYTFCNWPDQLTQMKCRFLIIFQVDPDFLFFKGVYLKVQDYIRWNQASHSMCSWKQIKFRNKNQRYIFPKAEMIKINICS